MLLAPAALRRKGTSVNVAEQLVQVLLEAGVARVHGVVGDSLNPVVDAIRRTEGIDWVAVQHEEAAAFAAAEAQLTGRLAVCAGSAGPGTVHLLQALYDANRGQAPVLALTSHIHTDQIGTGFFQETHPERVFVDASVWCEPLARAEQMPRLARIAVQQALGTPGVSVLVLPGDVADLRTTHATGAGAYCVEPGRVQPPPARPSPWLRPSTRPRGSRCSVARGCVTPTPR